MSGQGGAKSGSIGLPAGLPLLGALEATLNHFLLRSQASIDAAERLNGTVLAVQLREFGYTLYWLPSAAGIQLTDRWDDKVDVNVTGSLPAFVRMLMEGEQISGLRGAIDISGDVLLAQEYQQLLSGLDLDWEDELSKLVGDIAAHQIGRFARSFFGWGRRAATTLLEDSVEYLREESRDLVHPSETEGFIRSVGELRNEVDRIEQRLNRLQRQSGQANDAASSEMQP